MPDFTIKEILLKSSDYLKNKGVPSPRYDTELILSHVLKMSRMSLYLEFERNIAEEQAGIIRQAIVERGKRKPLQYILGSVRFGDCIIEVNENVLIPRPETEFMVDKICKTHSYSNRILDICTGSGAIAIALKKRFSNAEVFATDVCEKALNVAINNARKNECEIKFIQSDLFDAFRQGQSLQIEDAHRFLNSFDTIVSNPPYISDEDFEKLEPELFFEPKTALVAENNGLYF